MSRRFTAVQLISNEYVPIPNTDPVEYKAVQSVLISCECDTTEDLPNMNYTSTADTEVTLVMSSTAHIIEDNTIYEMKSDGSWVIQDEASRLNVYTKDETDQLLEDMADSQANVDLAQDGLINQNTDALADVIDAGHKNIFTTSTTTSTITDVTFTNNNDGTWTVNGTAADRRQKALAFTLSEEHEPGRYVLSGCPSGGVVGSNIIYCLYLWDTTANVRISQNDTGNGVAFDWTPDITHQYQIVIDIRSGTTADNLVFKPMICTNTDWVISNKFVPYKPDMDVIQNSLLEEIIDGGAKNKIEMTHAAGSVTRNGVTCTWDPDAGTMTLTGSHAAADSAAIFEFYSGNAVDQRVLKAGTYRITGCPTGGSTSTYRAALTQISGAVDTGNGATFTLANDQYGAYRILVSGNCDFSTPAVFKPMVCPQDAYEISDAFVPFCPTLAELYNIVKSYHS